MLRSVTYANNAYDAPLLQGHAARTPSRDGRARLALIGVVFLSVTAYTLRWNVQEFAALTLASQYVRPPRGRSSSHIAQPARFRPSPLQPASRTLRFTEPLAAIAVASDEDTAAALEAAAALIEEEERQSPPKSDLEPDSDVSGPPPGLAEDSYFQLDESVAVWKSFQRDGPAPPIDNIREALSIASQGFFQHGRGGIVYSMLHGLKTGYFVSNGVLGTVAFELYKRVSDKAGAERAFALGLPVISRMLLEAMMCYRQDYRAIEAGLYKAPWDMYTPSHRQYRPSYAARQTLRFVREAIATLGRRSRGGLDEDMGIWLDSPLYPDYYVNNFHYQTDGWMSSRSAKVYETSTETLFIGRQDTMQRLSLIPLRDVAAVSGRTPRILEVACGTGRFATFIRDNHPTAEMTVVDLSPFYLEAARENDEYWRRKRYPSKEARPPPATFVQASAEKLPFEDSSFDAVVCVYLFHELPEDARARAAAEMARVVAPGGTLVLTDSMQRGDRPSLDIRLKNFAKLNEPHYDNYVNELLPELFVAAGLTCDRKWVESSTKCLSFRKPAAHEPESVASPSRDA